jgi:hypothetical protein
MSARWTKLGAKPADRPYIEFYARKLRDNGWSESDIDTAIGFGLKHQHEGWAKFEGLAIHEMQKRGIDGTYINEVLTPGDIIQEQPDIRASLEAHSFAETHANLAAPKGDDARLAEIQKLLATDSDAYFRDAAMVKEHEALLAAKEPGAAPYQAPAPTERRLAEIQQLMKDDGGRGYWNNPAIQQEHFALVEASLPQEAADVGT